MAEPRMKELELLELSVEAMQASLQALERKLDERCNELHELLCAQATDIDLLRQDRLGTKSTQPSARSSWAEKEPDPCSGVVVNLAAEAADAAQEACKGSTSGAEDVDPHELHKDYYTFSESTWSTTVFIGSPALGTFGSAMVALLLLLTVVMQLLFCGIVIRSFTVPEFSAETTAGLRAWRLSVAHNLRYIDDLNDMSLASRVCSSSDFRQASLEMSTAQADQVQLIRRYLASARRGEEPNMSDRLFGGPVLCAFILVCYYATLVQEFQDIIRMVWGLSVLPRRKTSVRNSVGGSGSFTLDSITCRNYIFLVLAAGFRAAIACVLCFAGTQFIVNTVDMRDLLMNAVALAFVLEIDELLFSALAPVRAKNLINSVEPLPLPIPRGRLRKCSEFISVGTFLLLGVALCVAWFVSLRPVIGELLAAEEAICGGRQDFVFVVDGTGTLSWTQSRQVLEEEAEVPSTHLSRALDEVMDLRAPMIEKSRQVSSVTNLHEQKMQSVADAADEGLCHDRTLDLPLRELLREILSNQTVSGCEDVEQHCNDDSIVGVRVRQVCPQTCGCSTIGRNSLLHRNPLQGCGSKCTETPDWVNDEPATCVDSEGTGRRRWRWENFAKAVAGKNSSASAAGEGFWRELAQKFKATGCAAIPTFHLNYTVDLCLDPDLRPILLALCPKTCGCNWQPSPGCPLACFTNRYGAAFMRAVSMARGYADGVIGAIGGAISGGQVNVPGLPGVPFAGGQVSIPGFTPRRRWSAASPSTPPPPPAQDSNATTTAATTAGAPTTTSTPSLDTDANLTSDPNVGEALLNQTTTTASPAPTPSPTPAPAPSLLPSRRRAWWR